MFAKCGQRVYFCPKLGRKQMSAVERALAHSQAPLVRLEPVNFVEPTQVEFERKLAKCADPNGIYTPLFFSEDPIDIDRARVICRSCSIRRICLQGALDREEACGVWGGELISDGKIVIDGVKRKGRPPQKPREKPILYYGVE